MKSEVIMKGRITCVVVVVVVVVAGGAAAAVVVFSVSDLSFRLCQQ